MKLSGLKVENYRGIEALTLNQLYHFNVFVGKNNSGKSTILASINYLFDMLKPELVSSIATRKDFHNYTTTTPIRIAGSFELDATFHDQIINAMKADLPQMQSAIENLRIRKFLNIYTNTMYDNDSPVSYIEKMSLSESCPFDKKIPESTLLLVDKGVVRELVKLAHEVEVLEKNIISFETLLTRRLIDNNDFARFKENNAIGARRRYYFPELPMENQTLHDLIDASPDYSTFTANLQQALDGAQTSLIQIKSTELTNPIEIYSGTTRSIPSHVSMVLQKMSGTRLLHEQERKKQIDKEDAQKLLNLKMKRGGMDNLNELQKIVRDLLDVHVDAFGSDEGNSPEIDVDDFLVGMNGAGIREALRLVLDVTFSSPDVILIEEPEVHLHFGLEQKLFRYLMGLAKDKQIFLTTHSTGFIDKSGANNVFLVRKNTSTTVDALNDTDMTNVLSDLGISLSSLLLARILIFVEGPTDEYIIRGYLESNHPAISSSDIGFVRMNGIGNYRYFADSSTLELLAKRNLKTVFVIDSDTRDDKEIQRIIQQHPENSQIHVLPAYCIENFFLEPQILHPFIKHKLNSSGTQVEPPSIEEVTAKLDEVVDALYPETIRLNMAWKYLKPIYMHVSRIDSTGTLDDAIQEISQCLEKAHESLPASAAEFEKTHQEFIQSINELWEHDKFKIVPGDKVIDELCKLYGVRYNKTQGDSDLLIHAVSSSTWPESFEKTLGSVIDCIQSA